MRTVLAALAMCAVLFGCGSYPLYKSMGEFRADVSSWGLRRMTFGDAKLALESKGFKCSRGTKFSVWPTYDCVRAAEGLPCKQIHSVSLELDDDEKIVRNFSVVQYPDGSVPSVCM